MATRGVPKPRPRAVLLVTVGLMLGAATFAVGRAAPPGFARPAEQAPPVSAAWVAFGPNGAVIARAITSRPSCPDLTLPSGAVPMLVRAPAAPPSYPALVCEAQVPQSSTGALSIAGVPLPPPMGTPQRVVVIGDTGCRLKEGDPIQDCNDPRAWPFARLARSAAAWQPDLVVHVGDYLYREMPCPPKHAGCAGSPWGDTGAAWNADFFTPAAPLLRAAPWVFVRGNHEVCSRAGQGWFRLLDPRTPPARCDDYTAPYAVPLGDLRLLVLDAASADDFTGRDDQVATYRAQYAELLSQADGPSWLLQHRPLWAIGQSESPGPSGIFRSNPTLQAASGNALPAPVALILSGHIHNWTLFGFADARSPQLVVGNSGTDLDPPLSVAPTGLDIAGTTVALGRAWHDFGFLTLEPDGVAWRATLRDVDGAPVLACTVADRMAACAP